MHLLVPISVNLSPDQVRQVARSYLSGLTNEEWVEERDGKLVLRHEVATSHRFDTDVQPQDPKRIEFVKAVQDFLQVLDTYEKEIK